MKQKQRERMQPKMGKLDIDYQVTPPFQERFPLLLLFQAVSKRLSSEFPFASRGGFMRVNIELLLPVARLFYEAVKWIRGQVYAGMIPLCLISCVSACMYKLSKPFTMPIAFVQYM